MHKPAWLKRMLPLGLATALLTGCVTGAPKTVCGTVTAIDKATQAKAAAELGALPADSVLATIIAPDWVRQRDEARACVGLKAG